MDSSDYEWIGPFKVHQSITSGLCGWEPHYWSVLTLDTRLRIKKETQTNFRKTLERYENHDLEGSDPDFINHIILRAAGNAMSAFWRSCIYEHKKRLYDIQEGQAGRCGARKKNGQQCRARAINGTGRCRYHGGLSTGPKTIDGKIKSLSKLTQYRRNPALLNAKRQDLVKEMRRETGFY